MSSLPSVRFGTEPTEQVIRGGALKSPTLLTGLLVHRGLPYVRLRAKDRALRRFVLPPGVAETAAVTKVFLGITQAYHELVEEKLAALANAAADPDDRVQPDAPDKTKAMGLDAGSVEAPPRRRELQMEKQRRLQLPAFFHVPYPLHDGEWLVECLAPRNATRGVAGAAPIPLTVANLNKLHQACLQALGEMVSSPIAPLLPLRRTSSKAPKATSDGHKEHWDRRRGRWVARVRLSAKGQRKREKVLTRKPTDPTPSQPIADEPAQTQPAALHAPAPIEAEACPPVATLNKTASLGLD